MTSKYFKPLSLTWWASVAPLAAGLFVAGQDFHGLIGAVSFINQITDNAPPSVLINAGLFGIGLRGAV